MESLVWVNPAIVLAVGYESIFCIINREVSDEEVRHHPGFESSDGVKPETDDSCVDGNVFINGEGVFLLVGDKPAGLAPYVSDVMKKQQEQKAHSESRILELETPLVYGLNSMGTPLPSRNQRPGNSPLTSSPRR